MIVLSRLALLFSIITLFSCKQFKISDNERKAVSEISELYGGTCTYTMNTNLSTKTGKQSFFEIEVSAGDFSNENTMWSEMHASNFAYILFTHIKNDERRYNFVRTGLIYKDGTKIQFQYSLDSLQIVNAKMKYVAQIIEILKNKDYKEIDRLLVNDFLLSSKEREKYMNYIMSVDSTCGAIENFTPTGFKFNSLENNKQFLHISANLKRTIKDTQFSIDINPGEKDELYLLGYGY